MRLKEEMGVDKMLKREEELLEYLFGRLKAEKDIKILAGQHQDRLGVVSFNVGELYHDLAVKILNDRFGIQSRGGCSCAGTYGHYLLGIDEQSSDCIISEVESGHLLSRPGWVRVSIHPTTTNEELRHLCDGIVALAQNWREWQHDYVFNDGIFTHKDEKLDPSVSLTKKWFEL